MIHKIYSWSGHLVYNRSGLLFGMVSFFCNVFNMILYKGVHFAFFRLKKLIQFLKFMSQLKAD
jgi:hypothetical protein